MTPQVKSGGWEKSVWLILASRSPRRRELLAEAGYQFEVIPPSEEAEEERLRPRESAAELAGRLARQKAEDVARRIASRFASSSRLPMEAPQAADMHRHPPEQPPGSEGMSQFQAEEPGSDAGNLPPAEPALLHLPSQTAPKEACRAIVIGSDTVVECRGQILGKPHDREHARQILQTLCGQEHWVYTGLCLWPLPTGEPLCRVAASRLRMDPLRPEQLEEYLQSGQWQGKAGAFGYQDRLGWVHLLEGSESNVVGLPLELLAEMLAQMTPSRWVP